MYLVFAHQVSDEFKKKMVVVILAVDGLSNCT